MPRPEIPEKISIQDIQWNVEAKRLRDAGLKSSRARHDIAMNSIRNIRAAKEDGDGDPTPSVKKPKEIVVVGSKAQGARPFSIFVYKPVHSNQQGQVILDSDFNEGDGDSVDRDA
ncbi:MAG: hypothetical protein O3B01_23200 [Planctomycetota bacterium]|nr:hypothetical protein [Planctomycetota bacterium]MDA1141479.1 hypothetical protein [Planctomycetota bacterium]